MNQNKAISLKDFNINQLPENKDIWLDLGCGKGNFLVKCARRYPEKFLLGIDYSQGIADKAQDKIKRGNIKNALAISGDFRELLKMFPENSIEKIHIICPDPWFKKRHRKRRTVTYELMKYIFTLLKSDGEFIFATDFCPYMLTVIKEDYEKFYNPYNKHPWVHKIKNFPYSTYMEKSLDSDGRIFFMRRIKK